MKKGFRSVARRDEASHMEGRRFRKTDGWNRNTYLKTEEKRGWLAKLIQIAGATGKIGSVNRALNAVTTVQSRRACIVRRTCYFL